MNNYNQPSDPSFSVEVQEQRRPPAVEQREAEITAAIGELGYTLHTSFGPEVLHVQVSAPAAALVETVPQPQQPTASEAATEQPLAPVVAINDELTVRRTAVREALDTQEGQKYHVQEAA